jgi:hypothetical protein
MNLEKDTSPTGFYNYLPKLKDEPRKRKTRRRLIGKLKPGLMKAVGYDVTASKTARHKAVDRAVKKYGKLSTLRKLNAVRVYTRRASPKKSRTFKSDVRYVQKKYY